MKIIEDENDLFGLITSEMLKAEPQYVRVVDGEIPAPGSSILRVERAMSVVRDSGPSAAYQVGGFFGNMVINQLFSAEHFMRYAPQRGDHVYVKDKDVAVLIVDVNDRDNDDNLMPADKQTVELFGFSAERKFWSRYGELPVSMLDMPVLGVGPLARIANAVHANKNRDILQIVDETYQPIYRTGATASSSIPTNKLTDADHKMVCHANRLKAEFEALTARRVALSLDHRKLTGQSLIKE